ncbi:hypothetical protein KIL84_016235 [Mauremys mutica]|uniref:Uncharacterized protein n=1 Tax=Mauremys mutica TaxID=74926 RepID=A0A9D3WTI7_9SAUR|nr:hypothetical protein KIL84_016235 [Mauremys mutica]
MSVGSGALVNFSAGLVCYRISRIPSPVGLQILSLCAPPRHSSAAVAVLTTTITNSNKVQRVGRERKKERKWFGHYFKRFGFILIRFEAIFPFSSARFCSLMLQTALQKATRPEEKSNGTSCTNMG